MRTPAFQFPHRCNLTKFTIQILSSFYLPPKSIFLNDVISITYRYNPLDGCFRSMLCLNAGAIPIMVVPKFSIYQFTFLESKVFRDEMETDFDYVVGIFLFKSYD